MNSEDFHTTLQLLINAIEEDDITYDEYAQSYQALLEQFELEDEV